LQKSARPSTVVAHTSATPAYVRALQKIAARYPQAKRIHLVQDNLNTHSLKSAVAVLGALEGRRLWRRFEVHYTPKHGSWLNAAERSRRASSPANASAAIALPFWSTSSHASLRGAERPKPRGAPSTEPFVSMMRDGSFATMGSSRPGRSTREQRWHESQDPSERGAFLIGRRSGCFVVGCSRATRLTCAALLRAAR
jgi:hypothetical protein